jgi:hypothetical protein
MPTQVQIHDCPLPYPFEVNLARGGLIAHKALFKFGFNGDINGTEETIWSRGGLYVYPTVAEVNTVSSTSANDTAEGTGARTVSIFGLDANYNEISETVSLNGQTPVNTVNAYLRINRMFVATAGSGNAAAGTIAAGTGTVTSGVPAVCYAEISNSDNQTLMAVWTVPAGYTAYIYKGTLSNGTTSGSQFVTARLCFKPFGGVIRTAAKVAIHNQFVDFDFGIPVVLPEKTDIEARAFSSSNNNAVSATFTVMYTKN